MTDDPSPLGSITTCRALTYRPTRTGTYTLCSRRHQRPAGQSANLDHRLRGSATPL